MEEFDALEKEIAEACGRSTRPVTIKERVGDGAFAVVYRAVRRGNPRQFALKAINVEKAGRKGVRKARIMEEANNHRHLDHRNVVRLDKVIEGFSHVFLELELCDCDLRSFVREKCTSGHRLDEDLVAKIFSQITKGLLYLHEHRVIHRDLSPGNILVAGPPDDYVFKIGDLGLSAKLSDMEEKKMTVCGTPRYMAPEVAAGSPHGKEADVWSLGCILYFLLTGNDPQPQMTNLRALHASVPAKELLRGLTSRTPRDRIKLEDVLNDPFLTGRVGRPAVGSRASVDSGRGGSFHDSIPCRGQSRGLSPGVSDPGRRLPPHPNNYQIRGRSRNPERSSRVPFRSAQSISPSPSSARPVSDCRHSQFDEDKCRRCGKSVPPTPRCRSFNDTGRCGGSCRSEFSTCRHSQVDQDKCYRCGKSVPPTPRSHATGSSRPVHSSQLTNTDGPLKPIQTARIPATQFRKRPLLLRLLEEGDVYVEKFNNDETVEEVLHISGTGKVESYKPGVRLDERRVARPNGSRNVWELEELPGTSLEPLFKFAAKYVDIMARKIPKVTYKELLNGEPILKATLMESGAFHLDILPNKHLEQSDQSKPIQSSRLDDRKPAVLTKEDRELFRAKYDYCKDLECRPGVVFPVSTVVRMGSPRLTPRPDQENRRGVREAAEERTSTPRRALSACNPPDLSSKPIVSQDKNGQTLVHFPDGARLRYSRGAQHRLCHLDLGDGWREVTEPSQIPEKYRSQLRSQLSINRP